MVSLEVLSAQRGHSELFFKDVEAEERAKLAETILRLLQEKHVIFLIQGTETRRIMGYDAETNDWLVRATAEGAAPEAIDGTEEPRRRGRPRLDRVPADETTVTTVAPTAGG